MVRLIASIAAGAVLLGSCAPAGPRMLSPKRVDAFCGDRYVRSTAVQSILTSVGDRIEPDPPPAAAEIERELARSTGVIAHWDDQPLLLPGVARQLGYAGRYVSVADAAIGNNAAAAGSRRIYLTLMLPGGRRTTFVFRAYDMQNVCNEGRLSA